MKALFFIAVWQATLASVALAGPGEGGGGGTGSREAYYSDLINADDPVVAEVFTEQNLNVGPNRDWQDHRDRFGDELR